MRMTLEKRIKKKKQKKTLTFSLETMCVFFFMMEVLYGVTYNFDDKVKAETNDSVEDEWC